MKLFALVALVAVAGLLLGKTSSYLLEGIDPQEGVTNVLGESERRTGQGGSTFDAPSAISSPAKSPSPSSPSSSGQFPFEANNAQVAVTALESTLLLGLLLARAAGVWQALRHPRRRPYVAFVAVYSPLFVFAFSSIANFGILARERTQVLPFFLVLLAIPRRGAAWGRRPPRPPRGGTMPAGSSLGA